MNPLPLVTDPAEVRRLAREREDVNVAFRRRLRNSDLDDRQVDAVVHRAYRDVSARIDCRECANCCRELVPALGKKDVARLAATLQQTPEQFSRAYLTKSPEPGRLEMNRKPCPLLEGKLCRLYDDRPEACRGYPFLDRPDFNGRSLMVLWNLPYCPLVFNTYEIAKLELGPLLFRG